MRDSLILLQVGRESLVGVHRYGWEVRTGSRAAPAIVCRRGCAVWIQGEEEVVAARGESLNENGGWQCAKSSLRIEALMTVVGPAA